MRSIICALSFRTFELVDCQFNPPLLHCKLKRNNNKKKINKKLTFTTLLTFILRISQILQRNFRRAPFQWFWMIRCRFPANQIDQMICGDNSIFVCVHFIVNCCRRRNHISAQMQRSRVRCIILTHSFQIIHQFNH